MEIVIPQRAEIVLQGLETKGFEAYVVGGCVRDAILGRVPGDWDITTSARPEEIKDLFRVTIDTGIQHGTVTVLIDKEPFEVTTYRIDGKYEDGRHPSKVSFTASLQEDLRRRDFTINAMAYHPGKGLVDLYGGIQDLEAHRIRCVGNAEERFQEDALRILRALRFASQLDFDIENLTLRAIRRLAGTLSQISAERIQKEMTLMLCSVNGGKIREAYENEVTAVILPEIDAMMEVPQNNPHHIYTVGEHCIRAMEYVNADQELPEKTFKKQQSILKWAMLLHDIGKPQVRTTDENGVDHFYGHAAVSTEIASKILHRLKFDNETCDTVKRLIQYHDYPFELTEKAMRRAIHKIGADLFPLLFRVREADIAAQNPELAGEKREHLREAKALYQLVIEKGNATSIKQLAVTGRDLIEIGIPQGKQLGAMLAELLEQVLEEPERNEREWLLQYAKEHCE